MFYGILHLYVFLKAKHALSFSTTTGWCLMLLMLIMIIAPLIVHISEKAGFVFIARLMAYVGYTWLGLIFLFVSSALSLELYRLIIYSAVRVLQKDLTYLQLSSFHAFLIPVVLSFSIAVYGYFEARHIRTERVLIKSPKIPKEIERLNIVQISDIHLGLIVRQEKLKRILKQVKIAKPDILVSTGDLVDGQIGELDGLIELFQEIKPKFGKFAITGNHEFYAGLDQSQDFTKQAGFKILRGESISVGGVINIAGVDDPTGRYFGEQMTISEKDLLSSLPENMFTLLLKHRPLIDKKAVEHLDLQLSGHTHKGQIFPFSIITWLYFPDHAGCKYFGSSCYLYVSRGSGTWGPPIRFLSPPVVTVFELVHGN
jgi:predicted MPP superfamily phosphohydrolase